MGIGADFAENIKQVKMIASVLHWDDSSSKKDSQLQPTQFMEIKPVIAYVLLVKIYVCFDFLSKQ